MTCSPPASRYSGPPTVALPPRDPGRRRPALLRRPPVILRHQPEPVGLHVATNDNPDAPTTAIARTWADGDEHRCRLCPREHCNAYDGVCLVVLNLDVPADQARMFSTVGLSYGGDS